MSYEIPNDPVQIIPRYSSYKTNILQYNATIVKEVFHPLHNNLIQLNLPKAREI